MKKIIGIAAAVLLDVMTLGTPALADSGAAVVPGSLKAAGPSNPLCVQFQTFLAGNPTTVDPTTFGFSTRDPAAVVSLLNVGRSEDAGFPLTFTVGAPSGGYPSVWFPGDCSAGGVVYSYGHKG